MEYDVWFTRYNDELFVSLAEPDDAPMSRPRRMPSAHIALSRIKGNGHTVRRVGIVPPDALGLE